MNNVDYIVQRTNPNDEFVIIGSWRVKSGTSVKAGDHVCNLEATKNNYDVESPASGYIFYAANEGDRVDVGSLLFVVSDDSAFEFQSEKKTAVHADAKLTRKAQKLIAEYGIDIREILKGSERVGEKEVREFVREKGLTPGSAVQPSIGAEYAEETLPPTKVFEVHFMSQARDVIYSRVVREIPHEIVLRTMKANEGVTLGEAVAFSTIDAVKKYPYVNACFAHNKIRRYLKYNMGLAINIGMGLKVPVLKDFDQLSLAEVSYKFKEASMKYIRDELDGGDFADGTFTITDLSSLQVKDFMPIVYKDQGAILGICAVSGSTHTFNLVLGFDHRVIDGMYAAQFLGAVEDSLRNL